MTPARLFFRHMLWAPLVALPLALAIGAAGLERLAKFRALGAGVEVTGTVTHLDREKLSPRSSTPRVDMRTWEVSYRFETAAGIPVEGRAEVPSALFDRLELGGPIALRHAAEAPARNDAVGSLTLRQGLSLTAFALLLGAAGVVTMVQFVPRAASIWRAARSGPARMATVEELRPRYAALPKNPDRRVIWRDPETGATGEASRWHRTDLPAPGDAIPVRIDPRTGRTWWEAEL